ncbi:MAG TPA: hemerythrin domain-containing protein [Candidatus Binatia bacterium]
MKATELLKRQHREVKNLFREAKKAEDPEERLRILGEIEQKLDVHMMIEEEIFYPAVREVTGKKTEDLIPEAYEEHHVAKLAMLDLKQVDPDDERMKAKITVLEELIEHHVEEEEKEVFKLAEKLGAERLAELAEEMEAEAASSEELGLEGDEDLEEDEEGGESARTRSDSQHHERPAHHARPHGR